MDNKTTGSSGIVRLHTGISETVLVGLVYRRLLVRIVVAEILAHVFAVHVYFCSCKLG